MSQHMYKHMYMYCMIYDTICIIHDNLQIDTLIVSIYKVCIRKNSLYKKMEYVSTSKVSVRCKVNKDIVKLSLHLSVLYVKRPIRDRIQNKIIL